LASVVALGDGDQVERYAMEALAQEAALPAAIQPFSPMLAPGLTPPRPAYCDAT